MAQFTKYSSTDASAPKLTGAAGSLIAVLDAVLVTGYGSKSAAGWSHPVATTSNIATYKQGAASKAQATLLVNDAGLHVTATFKEANCCGWRNCTGVGTPMGAGTGQFPLPPQMLTNGHVTIRKSFTADTVVRAWTIYADDKTFFLFIRTGDGVLNGQTYASTFGFGEYYSYAGSGDLGNCFISGTTVDNSASAGSPTNGGLDTTVFAGGTASTGLFLMDSIGGSQGSVKGYPYGDFNKMAVASGTSPTTLIGTPPCPNPADGAIYIVPILILDGTGAVRGRHRGLYAWMHPIGCTSDGAVFVGANDLAGKTLTVVGPTWAIGNLLLETSATVDTN